MAGRHGCGCVRGRDHGRPGCEPDDRYRGRRAGGDKPPKGIRLETIEQLRRYAKQIVEQAVVGRMMPLGNETDMTDEERDRLGAWAESLK
jgi:hypothetical protein